MVMVLRTSDILENIFNFLDASSLSNVEECSQLWADVTLKTSQWKKLGFRLSKVSHYNKKILQLKGLDESFEDKLLEYNHFKKLCVGLSKLKDNYKHKVPTEVLLSCEATELKSQGIVWEPQWGSQHTGWICNFKFNNNHLVVAVIDTLQVWDINTKKCLSILQVPDDEDDYEETDHTINALDVLGNLIVAGFNDGMIRVWDFDTGNLLKYVNCQDSLAVNALMFGHNSDLFSDHDDGKVMMFSGHDDGKVMIWEVKYENEYEYGYSINLTQTLEDQSDIIWGLDVNDKLLVSCSEDCSIAVYNHTVDPGDANSFELAYKVVGHEEAVTCLRLLGSLLVSGGRDKTVRLWRLQSLNYEALVVLKGHQELLLCVNLDEERIYSSDKKGELIIWDLEAAQDGRDGNPEEVILRKLNFEERGGIDCIQINGSQVFTSHDNFGKIVIHDFW